MKPTQWDLDHGACACVLNDPPPSNPDAHDCVAREGEAQAKSAAWARGYKAAVLDAAKEIPEGYTFRDAILALPLKRGMPSLPSQPSLFHHRDADGNGTFVSQLEAVESSDYKRTYHLTLTNEKKLWATPYAALVAMAQAVVTFEDKGHPSPWAKYTTQGKRGYLEAVEEAHAWLSGLEDAHYHGLANRLRAELLSRVTTPEATKCPRCGSLKRGLRERKHDTSPDCNDPWHGFVPSRASEKQPAPTSGGGNDSPDMRHLNEGYGPHWAGAWTDNQGRRWWSCNRHLGSKVRQDAPCPGCEAESKHGPDVVYETFGEKGGAPQEPKEQGPWGHVRSVIQKDGRVSHHWRRATPKDKKLSHRCMDDRNEPCTPDHCVVAGCHPRPPVKLRGNCQGLLSCSGEHCDWSGHRSRVEAKDEALPKTVNECLAKLESVRNHLSILRATTGAEGPNLSQATDSLTWATGELATVLTGVVDGLRVSGWLNLPTRGEVAVAARGVLGGHCGSRSCLRGSLAGDRQTALLDPGSFRPSGCECTCGDCRTAIHNREASR
jgi:hypothetical protein